MITAGEPQEYFPLGREHLSHHPGEVYLPVDITPAAPTASVVDFSRDLLRALQGVTLNDRPQKESWFLKEDAESDGEEEFYYSGKTVVWSHSSGHGTRKVYKSYTMENPIRQILWTNFNACRMKPRRADPLANVSENTDGSFVMSGVCVIESSAISVFTKSGEDFCTSVPFLISNAWATKYGLLFQRCLMDISCPKRDSDSIPIIFSMLHPLDDLSPIIKKIGSSMSNKISYFCSTNEEIIFTSSNPSLAVIYNKVEGIHSVWKLRTTTFEEADYACSKALTDSQYGSSTPISSSSLMTGISSNQSKIATHYQTPGSSYSPFRSYGSSRIASPVMNQSLSFSPTVSNLTPMATLSRSYSPAIGQATQRRSYTPLPLHIVHRNSFSPADISYSCEFLDPLAPDICFEHEWTEVQSGCHNEAASKVFLSTDVTDHNFLCFLLKKQHQLKLIKFEESNDNSMWIFGTSSFFPAIDAEVLPSLNLIIVLDSNYSLSLYTGPVKVSKVFISDFSLFGNLYCDKPLSAVQRRGSLITSTRPTSPMNSMFGDETNCLSPVSGGESTSSNPDVALDLSITQMGMTKSLRDAVRDKVTLETSAGYYRISLPKIASSAIVNKCLQALRSVLPRDIYTHVFVKWYSYRNAPGPKNVSSESELNSFLLCLLDSMGYDNVGLSLGGFVTRDSTALSDTLKRQKTSEFGCDDDWKYLTMSNFYASAFKNEAHWIGLELNICADVHTKENRKISTSALIHPYMANILFCLHLVYEDCKLNVLQWNDLAQLCSFLFELARDLHLNTYMDHYWKDFPSQFKSVSLEKLLTEEQLKKIHCPYYFAECPSIYNWIQNVLRCGIIETFPYIPYVTVSLRNIIIAHILLTEPGFSLLDYDKYLTKVVASSTRVANDIETMALLKDFKFSGNPKQAAVTFLTKIGMSLEDIDALPVGISLGIRDALLYCRNHPLSEWSEDVYNFIGRQDLMSLHMKEDHTSSKKSSIVKYSNETTKPAVVKESDDGFHFLDFEVLRLRFNKDHRIHDVCNMLQSSKPVRIVVTQRPEVSDHEFIEEQERHLYSLCVRTMALPVGRGMFTLRTYTPVVTETLPIPKLCLTGRAPPRNATVDLSHIDVPPNMNMWPLFHNGVAAGLRILPNASQVDSTWMVYNKPRTTTTDTPTEHAGFLMALGLNGHLSNLNVMSTHDYLCKGHELTSVGVLLGVSAAQHGTMDLAVTKLLSIHIEALLPPTSTELDVPPIVQVAAVLGIGLLYQGSGNHHMADVMLGEIGRPPGPEMEHCVDRESYSLAAGLALGLITFGRGKHVTGISDSPMADQLYHYMVGGHKRPLTGVHKEKHKSPSYQIREGDSVNVDVTSPGATLALGMMFFDSGNQAIADWMTAPDTQFLLDMVRPDFLLLRTVSKGLVMWSSVHPSKEWVKSHLPGIVIQYAFKRGVIPGDVDFETMSQAYSNIIAGACFCLGLKFAGSCNEDAFATLMDYSKFFLSLSRSVTGDQAGRSTIDTCLNITVISLAMVMAGSGELEVLRLCRYLRSRIQTSGYVLYGSHVATHMALGLLYLGGGRLTLGTSPLAIGSMLCAFYPKFPTHSNDNRYHLQAFYHLYVLAVEPRLIIPRQLESNKAVYTHVQIFFKDTPWYKGIEYNMKAPCHIPELKLLKKVIIEDSRYWPIVFDCDKNWDVLCTLLKSGGNLYLKQKAGCLPYSEDPNGFRSLMAQTFITSCVHSFNLKTSAMAKFSSDPLALNFAIAFLQSVAVNTKEKFWQQKVCGFLFECAAQEKLDVFPVYIMLIHLMEKISWHNHTLNLWHIKLLSAYHYFVKRCSTEEGESVLNEEFIISICVKFEKYLKDYIQNDKQFLANFLSKALDGYPVKFPSAFHGFLLYHGLPFPKLEDPPLLRDPSTTDNNCPFERGRLSMTTAATLCQILYPNMNTSLLNIL